MCLVNWQKGKSLKDPAKFVFAKFLNPNMSFVLYVVSIVIALEFGFLSPPIESSLLY